MIPGGMTSSYQEGDDGRSSMLARSVSSFSARTSFPRGKSESFSTWPWKPPSVDTTLIIRFAAAASVLRFAK
jgi:hypothetical protein